MNLISTIKARDKVIVWAYVAHKMSTIGAHENVTVRARKTFTIIRANETLYLT